MQSSVGLPRAADCGKVNKWEEPDRVRCVVASSKAISRVFPIKEECIPCLWAERERVERAFSTLAAS